MENITIFIDEKDGEKFAIIDHGNEQFTSMLKSTYDELQAQLTTEGSN